MKQLIKSTFGSGYKEISRGGDYVALSWDEYHDLEKWYGKWKDLYSAYEKVVTQKNSLQGELEAEQKRHRSDVRSTKLKAEKDVEDSVKELTKSLSAQVEALQSELEKEKKASENLYRISRERANSDRSLTPKKERSGFICYSQKQQYKSYGIYKRRKSDMKLHLVTTKGTCWVHSMQSPYSVEMDADTVLQLITDDDNFYMYYIYDLVADYKTGYWGFKYDTQLYRPAPADWMPPKKSKKK